MEFPAGTRIDGRYEVQGALGRGAMANVYVVRHVQLGSLHALKVLHLPTQAIRERLLLEGRIQSALRHRNVVAVTDVVDAEGSPGLIMDLVRGPPLDRLAREVPLSLDQLGALGTHILLGVQAAHRAGHVHRDLKPANVLVDAVEAELVAKVTDFGLAKLLLPEEQSATATRTGTTLGTPAYMSPEQLRDARNVDERADVFSLGALLYELVTGARAFPGDDVMAVFDAIRTGTIRPVRELRPDASAAMVRVIEAALLPDRDARTASVDQMLEGWTAGRGAEAGRYDWPAELITQVAAMATVPTGPVSRSTSESTWGGASVATPGVVRWEESVAPVAPGRRVPRLLLVAFTALVVSFVVGVALTSAVVALLAMGWLQFGDDAPVAEIPGSVPYARAEPAQALVDGRFDLLVAKWEAALGPLGSRDDQCLDPRPCLELAAGLLWSQDAHAWGWIELAADQAQRPSPDRRLADHLGAVVRGSVGLDDPPDRILDDPLTALVLAQVPALDPDARTGLLRSLLADRPELLGAQLLLARLERDAGRATTSGELLDAVLQAQSDHAPALALRAELALYGGDPDEALALAGRAGLEPLAVRVGGAAGRMGPGLVGPPTDARGRVAYHAGVAEAAYGSGFVSEAREELVRATTGVAPLDRQSAAWLQGQLALAQAEPAGLDEAARELRALAAEPLSTLESARLVNRADLLDAVRALASGDRELLERARTGLGSRPTGARWLGVLAALEQARAGGGTGPVGSLDGCVFRLLGARWAHDAGVPGAESALFELAAGDHCARYGVDRAARAEAWVRWAELRLAQGDRAAAQRGSTEFSALVEGTELPVYERFGALLERMDAE